MTLLQSWVESANDPKTDFPLNNLPYGVFSIEDEAPKCGVAIGDRILDVDGMSTDGHFNDNLRQFGDLGDIALQTSAWNEFMELGPGAWAWFRDRLTTALATGSDERESYAPYLRPMAEATLHLPFTVTEYTDFYASRHHAFNVGSMFRGPKNALPPNWLHMPIGYNGRASSVVVSGTPVTRPHGQLKAPGEEAPHFGPSRRFDFELELGAIVGQPSDRPLTVGEAFENIFGYVLLNDWSARDIQAWEYQPLGPFQSKATATTISPWIVTAEALVPFRVEAPERDAPLLPYLADIGPMQYDIALEVDLIPPDGPETRLAISNSRELYYSSAQQLAHHSSSGCPMRVGDLLGSGTISGPDRQSRGSLLELSWGGQEPIALPSGETRTFLEDGDTVTLRGYAQGAGYRIGFGECRGRILPAQTP